MSAGDVTKHSDVGAGNSDAGMTCNKCGGFLRHVGEYEADPRPWRDPRGHANIALEGRVIARCENTPTLEAI